MRPSNASATQDRRHGNWSSWHAQTAEAERRPASSPARTFGKTRPKHSMPILLQIVLYGVGAFFLLGLAVCLYDELKSRLSDRRREKMFQTWKDDHVVYCYALSAIEHALDNALAASGLCHPSEALSENELLTLFRTVVIHQPRLFSHPGLGEQDMLKAFPKMRQASIARFAKHHTRWWNTQYGEYLQWMRTSDDKHRPWHLAGPQEFADTIRAMQDELSDMNTLGSYGERMFFGSYVDYENYVMAVVRPELRRHESGIRPYEIGSIDERPKRNSDTISPVRKEVFDQAATCYLEHWRKAVPSFDDRRLAEQRLRAFWRGISETRDYFWAPVSDPRLAPYEKYLEFCMEIGFEEMASEALFNELKDAYRSELSLRYELRNENCSGSGEGSLEEHPWDRRVRIIYPKQCVPGELDLEHLEKGAWAARRRMQTGGEL